MPADDKWRVRTHERYCSFCGEFTAVVCAPAICICEACAKLVIEVFDENRGTPPVREK